MRFPFSLFALPITVWWALLAILISVVDFNFSHSGSCLIQVLLLRISGNPSNSCHLISALSLFWTPGTKSGIYWQLVSWIFKFWTNLFFYTGIPRGMAHPITFLQLPKNIYHNLQLFTPKNCMLSTMHDVTSYEL